MDISPKLLTSYPVRTIIKRATVFHPQKTKHRQTNVKHILIISEFQPSPTTSPSLHVLFPNVLTASEQRQRRPYLRAWPSGRFAWPAGASSTASVASAVGSGAIGGLRLVAPGEPMRSSGKYMEHHGTFEKTRGKIWENDDWLWLSCWYISGSKQVSGSSKLRVVASRAARQTKVMQEQFQMQIGLVYPSCSKLPGQTNSLNSLNCTNLKELRVAPSVCHWHRDGPMAIPTRCSTSIASSRVSCRTCIISWWGSFASDGPMVSWLGVFPVKQRAS